MSDILKVEIGKERSVGKEQKKRAILARFLFFTGSETIQKNQ